MRKLEVAANEAFDVYRELYYEGGVGSVYFWDLDDGFAGVILLKKGGLRRWLVRDGFANGDCGQGLRPERRPRESGTASMSSRRLIGRACLITSLRVR